MKIQDLEGRAYERAMDWMMQGATDHEWWDFVYKDITTAGGLMGIDVREIYFTLNPTDVGLEGDYYYEKGSVKAIKAEFPLDRTLHSIASDLQDIQKRNFYQLVTIFQSSNRGTSTRVGEVERDDEYAEPTDDAEDAVEEALQDFVGWAGHLLDKEYEYITSEGTLIENADANEYEFDEDGNIE